MDAPKPQPRAKLIEARKQRKLSQKQVAERIGTTYVNVSRWERGVTRPGPYFQKQLSRLFGKTEEDLDLALGSDGVPAPSSPSPANAASNAAASSTINESAPVSSLVLAAPIPTGEAIYDPSIPLLPPVHLVGRKHELESLRTQLKAGENVAMTALHGLPGVGKTTLAITLAHDAEMRAHFRDGILWAALGPHPDISSILSHWSLLLGVAPPDKTGEDDHDALSVQLSRAIGTRRMLLVIDDAWKLEDALFFKIGGPNCAHLVTTRFPTIAKAFAPKATSIIEELNEDESMDLLRMLAPQVVEHEPQKAQELALAVGGLPLALTLLGNYLHLQSGGPERRIAAALAKLSKSEERLYLNEPRAPTERHTSLDRNSSLSLQAVIDVTCQQLQPPERKALYALSIFPPKPGHFSEEAACFVANCDVEILDTLIDHGLLEYTDASRYRLHQTIADYARAALKNNPAPYERLVEYAANLVEKHRKAYELLEPEYDTIIAALEAAHDLGKTQALMRCTYTFIPYLRSRGLYDQVEKQLQRVLAAAERLKDDDSKSQAMLYLGEIAQKRGNYEQAETYLQDGLQLARQVGNPERISALLAELGRIFWRRGEYTRAVTYLNEGLMLARQINNPELICNILESLGTVATRRGKYDKSKTYNEEALKLAREMGDREKECTILINLGVAAGEQGNYAQEERFYLEALNIARKLRHKEWICALLSNLGATAWAQDHYIDAENYFREGLTQARQLDHGEWISVLLINVASILRKQGRYEQAEAQLQEALALATQLGVPQIICNVLYEYGNLSLSQNLPMKAQGYFNEILVSTPEGDVDVTALARFGLAQVAATKGTIDEARKLGVESLTILEAIGHHSTDEVRNWLETLAG